MQQKRMQINVLLVVNLRLRWLAGWEAEEPVSKWPQV